jgi:hypothetical protein
MKLNMKDFIPSKTLNGYDLEMEETNNEMLMRYYPHCGRYRVIKHAVPKLIRVDDSFWEVLGLMQGEMLKSTKSNACQIGFSNSNPDIINYFLLFFERFFHIKRIEWKASILVNSKNMKIDEIIHVKKHGKKTWSSKTGIPIKNFTKIHFCSKHGNSRSKSKYGNLNVRYSNTVFRTFIQNLLERLKKTIESNRKLSAAYLRGVLAAEGSCYIRKYYLNSVEIGATKLKDFENYENCLNTLGIKNYKRCASKIRICGWNNFYKLWKIGAFKLHKERERKFIQGFIKNENTRKLLLLNKFRVSKSLNEVSSDLARRTIHMHLMNLLKNGLIDHSRLLYRNNKGSWCYTWQTTPEGNRVLNPLKNLIKTKLGDKH